MTYLLLIIFAALMPHLSGTPGIEALELNDQTVNFFSRRGPAAPQDFELRKVTDQSVILQNWPTLYSRCWGKVAMERFFKCESWRVMTREKYLPWRCVKQMCTEVLMGGRSHLGYPEERGPRKIVKSMVFCHTPLGPLPSDQGEPISKLTLLLWICQNHSRPSVKHG